MNIVVDTNVIIYGLRYKGAPRKVLEALSSGGITGFTSTTVLREVEGVLVKKFAVEPFEWLAIAESVNDFLSAIPTPDTFLFPELRGNRDLHILAAADVCNASVIVSGDKDLLVLKSYKKTVILSPAESLERIG